MAALAFALAGLLLAADGTRNVLVLVPEAKDPESCFAAERIKGTLANSGGYRVLSAALSEGESLDAARKRLGAELAVTGTRKTDAGPPLVERFQLELAGDKGVERHEQVGPVGEPFAVAWRVVWPKDRELPSSDRSFGAPNAPALEAACRGDAEAAFAAAGASLGRSIAHLVPAPDRAAKETLLRRWARASTLARDGKPALALPLLKIVLRELESGAIAPVWRVPPSNESVLSSIQSVADLVVGFAAGTFVAFEAKSGRERWRIQIGPAQPEVVDAGEGLLLLVLANELLAVDAKDGHIQFRTALLRPQPEIAVARGRLFVAESQVTLALDRLSGKVVWTHDARVTPSSGPVISGAQLVVPLEAAVLFLDPNNGTAKKRLPLGDEITAPLLVTSTGWIWALVGSDEVVLIDPDKQEIALRVKDLPGVEWPPAVLAEQLIASARRANVRSLVFLDRSAKTGIKLAVKNAAPPVLALPDYSGLVHLEERPPALVARAGDGRVLWRHPERERIAGMAVYKDQVAAAAGKRWFALDRPRGKSMNTLELDEPITRLVVGDGGAALLTKSGALYGLPTGDDPRLARWLEEARLELAESYLALGMAAPAIGLAQAVLDRHPDDLSAFSIFARSKARARPAEGTRALLELLDRMSASEPAAAGVRSTLDSLVGLKTIVALDANSNRMGVLADTVLLPSETGVVAYGPNTGEAPLWQLKGNALLENGTLKVDGKVRNPKTGTPAPAPPLAATGTATAGITIPPNARIIAIHAGPDRTMLQLAPLNVRPTGPPAPLWLYGANASTGAKVFDLKLPPAGVNRIQAIRSGWILRNDRQIRFLSAEKGLLTPAFLPPSPIVEVVEASEGPVFMRTADHQLYAIDPARGLLKGRAQLSPVLAMAAAGDSIAVLDANHHLLLFNAARALSPARP